MNKSVNLGRFVLEFVNVAGGQRERVRDTGLLHAGLDCIDRFRVEPYIGTDLADRITEEGLNPGLLG